MLPEIKLVIYHNDKVVKTVTKELKGQEFVKSIEDFQIIANATMTKLIEDSGDSGGDSIMEEDADNSDNEEESISVSPNKRKK